MTSFRSINGIQMLLLLMMPFYAEMFKIATEISADMDNPFLSTNSIDDNFDSFVNLRVKEKDLNKSINFAIEVLNRMETLETNLCWSKIHILAGSPSHGQLIDSKPEIEAMRQGKDALVASKATAQLMYQYCFQGGMDFQDCVKYISQYNLYWTPLHSSCPNVRNTCTEEELLSDYRSLDGSCNNKQQGVWGKSFTAYSRLLPSHYSDAIQSFRRSVHVKNELPSPRVISTQFCRHSDILDQKLTLAVMQWSQFVEHDLAHTASSKMLYSDNTIECCHEDGGKLSPRYVHPFCAPITIPNDDEFYSNYDVQCMSYVRSIPAMRTDCTFGPIQQMNQATHFLDGSQIYGSDIRQIIKLRKFAGGLLRVSKKQNRNFLPISESSSEQCNYKNDPSASCFISGDSRVNAQPQLTAMHTLWHREHNRIAVALGILNPDWNDEKIYQESRKIVIAEMQHITYNEWLPVVLGNKYVDKIKEINLYSEDVDASVSNSFATAALRVINSLMEDKLRLYLENRRVNMSLNLREHFYRPNTVQEPGHLDALVIGLATQRSQKLDTNLVRDITNRLYQNGDYGLDVLSLDIQRGRDHGLPSYLAFRTLCGLPPVTTFNDLSDVMTQQRIDSLQSIYLDPRDIDLLTGAMSETAEDGSLMGPTFSCIIADQFLRTKNGDRYFYTNTEQPKPFAPSQLVELSKVSLARIFCDNSDDIQTMQPNVFNKISSSNGLVSCISEDIPFVNLTAWTASHL